jgi:hypothetical protein
LDHCPRGEREGLFQPGYRHVWLPSACALDLALLGIVCGHELRRAGWGAGTRTVEPGGSAEATRRVCNSDLKLKKE